MISRLLAALMPIALLALAACSRMPEAECEKACLHHARLWFEDQWATKLAQAPEAERAALAEAKEAEWKAVESDPDAPGRAHCVQTCAKRSSKEQLDCILQAQDLAKAKACWEEED